jgi:predicted lipoprotein with Yx(FWY)xxD motif
MRHWVILAGAAMAASACDTYGPPPPPPPAGPMGPPPGSMASTAGNATLTTATKAPFGTYVVDGTGRSVYVLEGTRGGSGINRCSGPCLNVWPPLPATSPTPIAGSGLSPPGLRTISGFSGAQVAYSGWPLYYFRQDAAPGDTFGQGVQDQWGTWYLIRSDGEPIRPHY